MTSNTPLESFVVVVVVVVVGRCGCHSLYLNFADEARPRLHVLEMRPEARRARQSPEKPQRRATTPDIIIRKNACVYE
jgi:hypothetical protein